ncbi:MAG: Hpt domain-containing protein [Gemmatimonadaceae bacterium]|nr:Hpt domain-containing protein [Gemmatimonadaceae bacterium]
MTEPPASALPALDTLRSLGGDEFVQSMVQTFLEYATERMQAIRTATDAGDGSEAAKAAHSIKASAAQLGAMDMSAACAAVEQAGKAGDVAALPQATAAAEHEFAAAVLWLNPLR